MADHMQELKEMRIWVCWNRKEKDGRITKVPCAATGGATGTNEKYRNTWVTYEEAVAAAEREHFSLLGRCCFAPHQIKKDAERKSFATNFYPFGFCVCRCDSIHRKKQQAQL